MKRFFFGGVHPSGKKEMSVKSDTIKPIAPAEVIIPLRQHIGAPCKALVGVGDRVLLGQKIGDGDGLCVPVHASVSGTVKAIEARPHPGGQPAESIVIANDGKDEAVPFVGCDQPTEALDADCILSAVRNAGIVGMGGAAFPSDVKAMSAMKNVDTILANACECEPYITADDTLLRTRPTEVFEGMLLLHRVLATARMVIAIEDNKASAIEVLRARAKDYPGIEIVVLPTRYPQGSEKQLIQAVTGREVPPGGLPSHVGCVVLNVSTFAAIYRAVRLGMPLTERIVTVSGEGVANPGNFLVRIGTAFADVIAAAGGLLENADRVLNGGPMMGMAQADLSVPVVKATNSILCLNADKNTTADDPVCIRCGKCLSVCPMHLQPLYFYRFVRAGQRAPLDRLHVLDCMECGSCAYACPGKLPLVETIRQGKKTVKEAGAK